MKPDLSVWLGRRVRVLVDRPLGTTHPHHPDLLYTLDSGELPGTLSGNLLPIDAYLLGWSAPVAEAVVTVIAVIVRADDMKDKLAVARDGSIWSDLQILSAVHFQEQYFQVRLLR